jgi:alpha-tubulin suppressor-like RCC1 family protein
MKSIAAMSKFQRVPGCGGRLCLALLVLMPVLFGSVSKALAGTSVVAWGAGMIYNPADTNDYGQSIVPTDLTNAVMVAGGWWHSLALKADGTLQGWGDDSLGQIDFPSGTNYVAIACGWWHSLALKSDGTVAAAGYDLYGQTAVPADVNNNVVAVACGFYHSLALKSDGTVVAWGGQGSVNYGQGAVPPGLSNVVAIAGGGWHSLVLKSDGTLFAWGWDANGQTNIPAGLSNVVAIAAGAAHNLVLKADGTVMAWGLNAYGETNVPPGLSNVVAIAAGGWHNLALKSDGTVVAWGAGIGTDGYVDYGQNIVPTNLSGVVQIAAGKVHSLALVGSGPPVTKTDLVQPDFGSNGFSASLPTQNGRVYQLEYKNSLTDSTWQFLPLHAGTGGTLQLTDPAVASQRFYCVLRW